MRWIAAHWSATAAISLTLAGLLIGPFHVSAQTGLPSAEPGFAVVSWDSGGSVPGKVTTAMARTPDGYLWLGTQVGLIRFDGVRFFTMTTNTTPALGDNRISSLIVDRGGDLWIATQGGTLSRRHAGEIIPVPLDARLRGISIESLVAGDEGEVWLATDQWGLVRVSNGICDFSTSTNGLPASAAKSMVRLANGEWWAMAKDRLVTLAGGTWRAERFGLQPGTPLFALAPDRKGTGLWLATAVGPRESRGARVFKVEEGKEVQELAPYPWHQDSRHCQITSIMEDGQGRVWVGAELAGGFYWEPKRGWREFQPREGRSFIQIRGFYADAEGLLWMTTGDQMLHRITERRVATVPLPALHSKEIIISVCTTHDGTLWAGTADAGVFRFQNAQFVQVTNGLSSLNIGVLFEDSRTNLWVGSQSGLSRWDGNQFAPVLIGTAARAVYALCEDRHGNLWMGYGAQVVQLRRDGQTRAFGREAGLGNSFVMGLAEDGKGRICAIQDFTGLFRLNGDRFERLDDLHSQSASYRALLPDEDGSLWVTTPGQGLRRVHEDGLRTWSFEDGLPNSHLRSILPDGAGNLWFSASKGIFGCSKRALLDYQRGKAPPVLFWRLGPADGMEGNWTSGFGQPVAARSADGRLWIPNRNVVAVIDPQVVARHHLEPSPLIEEVIADGVVQPREPDGTLQLLSGARHLELHYTCADLQSPEVLRFRYCLEGFDDQWIEAGSGRVAHYGQLKPGDYRFRIQVGSDSGEWTECKVATALSVLPRWWEKVSVRLLGLLSMAGVLVGTTWRVGWSRHQRKIEKLELQLAREKERQELESRFRHVADSAPVMIWMSGPDKLYHYFNKGWIEYTGRSLEQELGNGWAEGVHPEDRQRCLDVYGTSFDARREFTMQYRLRKQDGQYGWILDTGVPRFGADGQFLGYLGSCVDITVHKEAEVLHRELAHIQRVVATGQLAATLAHELNQPLGAILRNAEAAELFLQQDPPDLEELRAILTDIRQDDQRAGAVIDRMRSLLKRRDLEFEPLGLKELVDQVGALMRAEIKMRHAAFEIGLPDGLPPVRGDRVQLQQLLLNLLMNGLDAVEDLPSERRRLSITARAVDALTVEAAVSDRGRGIPMERLSGIFKPFNTTKPSGLGMGLAISQIIISTHGGRIWAENNPEGGATFRFTLKVADQGGGA